MKKIYGYIVGIVVGLIIIIWFVIFITGYYKTKHNKNNINLENYTQATEAPIRQMKISMKVFILSMKTEKLSYIKNRTEHSMIMQILIWIHFRQKYVNS